MGRAKRGPTTVYPAVGGAALRLPHPTPCSTVPNGLVRGCHESGNDSIGLFYELAVLVAEFVEHHPFFPWNADTI